MVNKYKKNQGRKNKFGARISVGFACVGVNVATIHQLLALKAEYSMQREITVFL